MFLNYLKKHWFLPLCLLLALIALSTFMLKDQLTEKNYFKKYNLMVNNEGSATSNLIIRKIMAMKKQLISDSDTAKKHRYDLPANAFASNSHQVFTEQDVWVIQLTTLHDEKQAQDFVTALQEKGFRAYDTTEKTQTGDNYNIFVGPVIRGNDAAELAMNLQKEFHMTGLLQPYNPVAEG